MAKAEKKEPKIDISGTVRSIAGELSALQTEHERLTGAIEQAEASRTQKKADYENALAVGDEKRMSAALASIRKAVVDVPRLEAEWAGLADRLAAIDTRRMQILTVARERLQAAESDFAQARAAREAAESDVGRCSALLGQVNEARRLLSPASAPAPMPLREITDGPVSDLPDGPFQVLPQ